MSADAQMLDRAVPDESVGHLLPAGAVQLHRQPRRRHGRGEDVRAGLWNPRRQGQTQKWLCAHTMHVHAI